VPILAYYDVYHWCLLGKSVPALTMAIET